MKFPNNLERSNNPKKENGEVVEKELTPEQLEKQIEAEAGILKVNLESLRSEIESYGGPEKFKEYFEEFDQYSYNGNHAGQKVDSLTSESRRAKTSAKTHIINGISTLIVLAGLDATITLPEGTKFIGVIINLIWSRTILKEFASAIRDRIEAHKIDNKLAVKKLEFKITDTNVITKKDQENMRFEKLRKEWEDEQQNKTLQQ